MEFDLWQHTILVINYFNVLIFYNGIDSLMCLQDVKVGEGLKVALCIFDGGIEGTLILYSFAQDQRFDYIETSYSLVTLIY